MIFGICIESSHKKGMGHFYRMLNFINFLKNEKIDYVIIINKDKKSLKLLKEQNENFEIANYDDLESDWESKLIKKYEITHWINDRLDTEKKHSLNVIKNNIKLITFDDAGSGAEEADLNICAMPCRHNINKGKNVLKGIEYLILNSEIQDYRKHRKGLDKILVTLGGSDTYGITVKVAGILKKLNKKATIITGASFAHKEELDRISEGFFDIKNSVPSLIKEFYNYDLAITGGGITPFEATASGLPCIIIANEIHEIKNGKYLENLGSSIFWGYYDKINNIDLSDINVEEMSIIGLEKVKINSIERILKEIKKL